MLKIGEGAVGFFFFFFNSLLSLKILLYHLKSSEMIKRLELRISNELIWKWNLNNVKKQNLNKLKI